MPEFYVAHWLSEGHWAKHTKKWSSDLVLVFRSDENSCWYFELKDKWHEVCMQRSSGSNVKLFVLILQNSAMYGSGNFCLIQFKLKLYQIKDLDLFFSHFHCHVTTDFVWLKIHDLKWPQNPTVLMHACLVTFPLKNKTSSS